MKNNSVALKEANKTVADKKQLVIGLDFGAAFSKVVIGDKRVKYAVPFAEFAHPDNPYLLPSILNIDGDNHCHLSSAEDANGMTENLKFPLLENTCTKYDLMRLAGFMALVFRASTGWLLERYNKRYDHSDIAWSVNAGLPVDAVSDSELSAVYRQVLHVAWVLSVLPGPITLKRIRQYMDANDKVFEAFPALYRSRIIRKEAINTFAGCSAQICGYIHSTQCSDDLHMLIDVGAGTINIATFMVENATEISSDKKCTLYACVIEPIGVDYLLRRRYENLQLFDDEVNLFVDTPDNYAFSQAYELAEKDIKFADTLYSGEAVRLINRTMDITRQQYCPDSAHWQSGVKTFTYGGGAHLEILQNIIHRLENKSAPHKIASIKLTAPDDLVVENIVKDAYDRLSIAYGLSFEAAEIARVRRAVFTDDSEQAVEV